LRIETSQNQKRQQSKNENKNLEPKIRVFVRFVNLAAHKPNDNKKGKRKCLPFCLPNLQRLLPIGLIASFAVRAFKHIFRFANRNHWQNKKQRDVISAAFPDELPGKAAAVAAMLFGGFIRT
jgi:hypothetical protein